MITLTFAAQSVEALNKQLLEYLGDHPISIKTVPVDLEAAVKRGPGRPKKETPAPVVVENQTEISGPPKEVKAEVAIPAHTPATVAPVQSGPVDLDAVKAAVKKLTEHREGDKSTHDSIKRAVVVLGKFGATTIKELKPEQYTAFVAACQAA